MESIEIRNLTMQFGRVKALDNISLSIGGNKIYGLLGRNGAGKSTLLNLITNKIFATQGEILINNISSQENDAAGNLVYCMSEKTLYPESVRVKDVLKWTLGFYKNFDYAYAESLAKRFELDVNRKIKQLSTGYSSIFKLIIAMSVNVPYVFLDEPVLGLDANHRELFYRILIENYSDKPKNIIISTHLIEEISELIEQVIIIKSGQVILNKPIEEVLTMGYCVSGKSNAVDDFAADKKVLSTESLGGLKTVCILGDSTNVPDELEVTPLDLQKLFIQLTNA